MTFRTAMALSVSIAGAALSHAQQSPPLPASAPTSSTTPLAVRVVETDSIDYLLLSPAVSGDGTSARVVLALPPGTQTEDVARVTLTRYFGEPLAVRGYLIAMPFIGTGEASLTSETIDALAQRLATESGQQDTRIIVAGVQNGGRVAFQYAIDHPERVSALLVLPGLPSRPDDEETLVRLRDVRVAAFVGSEDARWRPDAELTHATLKRVGVSSSLTVVSGDGHMLPTITAAKVADALDSLTGIAAAGPEVDVGTMLDAWHAAAADADEQSYFAHFADDSSIFMGTDATERWTAPEFRAWAKPYFDRGRAWAFKPIERHVYLSEDQAVAWFDEVLDTPNMGPCRGTGVAVKRGGTWKVAHYNLTVPIPNAIVDRVVEMVAEELKNPTPPTPPAPAGSPEGSR